jgi:hypothetical protein
VDVAEALLPRIIRGNIELFYVKDDADFDKVGNIAALLRFRSEQNSNNNGLFRPIDAGRASASSSSNRREGYVARSRGIDHRMIL